MEIAPLLSLARSAKTPYCVAQRARILLLSADGIPDTEIAQRCGVSRPTIVDTRKRYTTRGLAGLEDSPRQGRPRTLDRAAIVAATVAARPRQDTTHNWTLRSLANHLAISPSSVARAWREYGVRPTPSGAFRYSTEPPLVARTVGIVGTCRRLDQKMIVLCATDSGSESTVDVDFAARVGDEAASPQQDSTVINHPPTSVAAAEPEMYRR
jgi:transposase